LRVPSLARIGIADRLSIFDDVGEHLDFWVFLWSNVRNALALDDDHLLARQPVGLAVEQLPRVNDDRPLTFGCKTRSAEADPE